MKFEECYRYMENLLKSKDFSSVAKEFSAILYLTGEENGYMYFSYVNGKKIIEPIRHNSANLYITMSTVTFEKLITGQADVLRSFTTGQIQAKGNVVLGLALYNALK